MYSLSQVLFFLFFLGLLFLLLIFGETTLGIFFLGALVFLCLCSATHIKRERVKLFLVPLGLLGLFVGVTFLSLVTTISVPSTINAAMFYAGAYVVFFTLLCIDPDWLPPQLILIGSCILGVIFAALTILYTVIPSLSQTLPTVSLLTALYGHNQASALFLFIFPVLWFYADRHENKLPRAAVVVIFIALLFSFSRVATVLAGGELAFLSWTAKDRKLRNVGKVLLGVLLMAVVLIGVFNGIGHSRSTCPFPILQEKLCKDIRREMRPAYWTQAIHAIGQRPMEGWGGGTFASLSPVLQKNYGEFSGYAHNEVLQAFAEYGLFGGVTFSLFFTYAGLIAVLHLNNRKRSLVQALSLGVLCVIVTSFFDFGLHMIGLWLFFLLGCAVVLTEVPSTFQIRLSLTKLFSNMVVGLALFCAVIVLAWTVAFSISEVLWSNGNSDLSLKAFPFAYWKVESSLQKNGSSGKTNEWLLSLYKNHYRAWDAVASSQAVSQSEKAAALKKAVALDPLSQYRYLPYLEAAIASGDVHLSVEAVTVWDERLNLGLLNNYTYEENGHVAGLAIDEANRLFNSAQLLPALQLYQRAYHIQNAQFVSHDIALFKNIGELSINETLPFLSILQYPLIYKQADDLYRGESSQLVTAVLQGNASVSAQLTENMLKLGGDYDWKLHELISSTCKKSTQQNAVVLVACAESIISWEKNTTTNTSFDYAVKHSIAQRLVQHVQGLQDSDLAQAERLQKLAIQIDSSVSGTH